MKFLDMPTENAENPAYEELLDNIERGRYVMVIPLEDNETYVLSGVYGSIPEHEIVEHYRLVKFARQAHDAARAEGHAPIHD